MRDQLYRLLGDLPPRERTVSARTVAVREQPGFLIEELILDLNGIEAAPAYFLTPKGVQGRVPAILYNHYHAGRYDLGKAELLLAKPEAGLPSYAESLTAAGYCVLCVDMWAFGGRVGRAEMDIFKEMLWNGRVMWGMMVFDSLKALDYLESRSEVDPGRMGTLGMSMGSTMAWWIAALDDRVKVCVDICCLTDFQALIESNGLSEHGIYYYVPSLLKHFTTAQINAMIAPRAHLSLAGTRDPLTPVAGLDRIERELADVYRGAGKPRNWRLVRYDVGHIETQEMRREAMSFLAQHL
jgi:dienelactone hydrolase